jgi:predicted phage tail protein
MGIVLKKPIIGSGGGGKGGAGSGGAVPSEDPNTLRSDSLARILDLLSEGEIEGLANDAESIYFDGTKLQDTSGNFNFQGVTWDSRVGLADQDYMPGFSAAEEEEVENVEVVQPSPIIRTFAGPLDAVRITLGIPQLTFQDPSNGNLHGSTVELLISIRLNGTSTWTDVKPVTITGKCVSQYQSSHRIELGGTDDWDVKVERITEDSENINLSNKTYWQSTTLITDGKFQYNNRAYLGLSVDAQQFGSSIPVRAYDIYGIKLQLPSNYDPETREYTGVWDGTFVTAWSDNPAWVLYDVLTNKRYGIGNFIDVTQVDKWGLYNIAQYCDELVPDGFGGMEPRYTFNYQITSMEDAYKVVQAIASNFRGLIFWSSGLVKVVADMPADPVKLVSPANVIQGDLTYEGVAFSARHSVCMVTWNDPDNLCQPAIELIEDPEMIAKLGWKPLSLTAYGCTSRSQAHRMGKWALDTERYATQTVNYQAAWDHIDVSPGEIIEVYDPDYQAISLSGRLKGSDSNSVTLDRTVTIEVGKVYTLRQVLPDNSLVSRVLTNIPGDATVLTFDEPLPLQPVASAIWGVTVSDLAPRQFRILSIKEGTDKLFSVSALFHDPTKYARVEQNIKLEPPVYSPFTNVTVPTPTGLTFRQYIYRSNGKSLPSVTFSWQAPGAQFPINGFQIQFQSPDQNWQNIISLRLPSYDLIDVDPGTWNIRVRCIGFNGKPGAWATLATVLNLSGAAPDDVTGFALSLLGHIVNSRWDVSPAPDNDHFRIKFQGVTSGASWPSSIDILPHVDGTSAQMPAFIGTYLIKAVNTAGVESVNATAVVTTAAALTGIDTVDTVDDAPTWSGAKTNTVVDSGVLKLDVDGDGNVLSSGTYEFASPYDLGAVYTTRLTGLITATGDNISNVMSGWTTLAEQETLSSVDPGDWEIKLEIRTTNDDPAGMSPAWSEWLPFLIGDYTCRGFEIRVTLISNDPQVNVDVSSIEIIIGMAQRTERKTGLTTLDSGELTVPITPSFYDVPSYVFTPHDLASGDYPSTTSKTINSVDLSTYDNTNTRVVRHGDLVISGHGYGT